ncbi:MAG TPA: phage baseplate assembly protein V [Thermoanaerobaculia bacterium]|nr:phage baseplate assembly protein V [Thermoanaerobaculia bacterium]
MIRDPLDTMNDPARRHEGRYFGKYRGLVKDNKDPLKIGRVQATVPSVPGMTLNWALPCVPYAGQQVGFYTIPPIGALVWIEFEGGDPTYPIWSGCFWNPGSPSDVPTEVGTNNEDPSQVKVFKTRVVSLWVDDTNQKGQVQMIYKDPTLSDPITVTVVMSSAGLAVSVNGSKGTSTFNMTPQAINTSSETLGTTTTKDTTITAQGQLTATITNDIAVTSSSGKLTGSASGDISLTSSTGGFSVTASAGDASFTVKGASVTASTSFSVTAGSSASITGTSSVSITSVSTKVSGATSLSLGGASISFMPA